MGLYQHPVRCMRCGQEKEGFVKAPYPGAIGALVLKNTCTKCYEEWQKFSVNVINDHKLRPFMPQDRAILEQQMKKFLNLEGPQEESKGKIASEDGQRRIHSAQPTGASDQSQPAQMGGIGETPPLVGGDGPVVGGQRGRMRVVSPPDVIEMLKQIFDPEIPVNIYDLGLIYDIKISGSKVGIKMTLTSAHCPAAQSLPETVKSTLERMPGIKEVAVEVVWDPPWTKEKISAEGRQSLGI